MALHYTLAQFCDLHSGALRGIDDQTMLDAFTARGAGVSASGDGFHYGELPGS
jgi:hypothetical protein